MSLRHAYTTDTLEECRLNGPSATVNGLHCEKILHHASQIRECGKRGNREICTAALQRRGDDKVNVGQPRSLPPMKL